MIDLAVETWPRFNSGDLALAIVANFEVLGPRSSKLLHSVRSNEIVPAPPIMVICAAIALRHEIEMPNTTLIDSYHTRTTTLYYLSAL